MRKGRQLAEQNMSEDRPWQDWLRDLGDLIEQCADCYAVSGANVRPGAPPPECEIPEKHVDAVRKLARGARCALREAGVKRGLRDDPNPRHKALKLVDDLLRDIKKNRKLWNQLQSQGKRLKRAEGFIEGYPVQLRIPPHQYVEAFRRAIAATETPVSGGGRKPMTGGQQALWDALEGQALTAKKLAEQLDTSENTIRQHVSDLRKAGCDIPNRRGRGYYRPDAPPEDCGV
jgi:biotin operon repressor